MFLFFGWKHGTSNSMTNLKYTVIITANVALLQIVDMYICSGLYRSRSISDHDRPIDQRSLIVDVIERQFRNRDRDVIARGIFGDQTFDHLATMFFCFKFLSHCLSLQF